MFRGDASGESTKFVGGKSLTFASLDMKRLSQSQSSDDDDDEVEEMKSNGIENELNGGDRNFGKTARENRVGNKTPERKLEGFDKWPRIKPRFGVQNLFPNKSFGCGGALNDSLGGDGTVTVNVGENHLNFDSPIRDSTNSKKREWNSPGSPDLFKTPSKRRKIEPRDPLLSPPPGRGGPRGAAASFLWGTDHSPLKTTPKKNNPASPFQSPVKQMNSPLINNFLSPSKRLVGNGSPFTSNELSPFKAAPFSHPQGLSPHPSSGINTLSRTPTKSPSIASILHLVTSPMKGDRKFLND